jgi:hypothetical protein
MATQNDDHQLRLKVATTWSKEFGLDLKPEEVNCHGCPGGSDVLFKHCKVCEIRKCAQERNSLNCAHCPDFACSKLDVIFHSRPDAKLMLKGIKNSLK